MVTRQRESSPPDEHRDLLCLDGRSSQRQMVLLTWIKVRSILQGSCCDCVTIRLRQATFLGILGVDMPRDGQGLFDGGLFNYQRARRRAIKSTGAAQQTFPALQKIERYQNKSTQIIYLQTTIQDHHEALKLSPVDCHCRSRSASEPA